MFPTGPQNSKEAKQLLKFFNALDDAGKKSVTDFAEFLSGKVEIVEVIVLERLEIPRPETESVVKAIKRLSATYPMIEKSKLFNDTSSLMSKHVMQGVPAEDIIDQLETIFDKLLCEMIEASE